MNLVGQKIGNYTLLRLLGTGSSSHVYLGVHKHDRSWVAIKILNTQATRERANRWEIETSMLTRICHPYIIHMHESGTYQNVRFLVTDWATQGTLIDLIAQPVSIVQVIRTLKQLA